MIVWKKSANNEEIPEPQRGLSEEFDRADDEVNKIKTKLN